MVKGITRSRIREALARLDQEQMREKSAAACRHLCTSEEFQQADTIMLYLSLEREVDTTQAVLKSFQQQKTVVVPSILWRERHLIPLTMSSLNCDMTHDRHGLRYPTAGRPMPIEEIDLIVVPGVGFDRQGNRLGRGGGFYDRFLSHNGFRGRICGLAFEEQVLDTIPVMEHDIRLHMLVTDRGVFYFHNPKIKEEHRAGAKDGS
ncbi:MAG TPA: 5-formyltetrahydrofolate cyclo-ligase [Anaerohalosphaeraceae bacterium]|nr:5-formyltetrahydrofolate cyclo-ligase [Anaerohalosphaeraceae bacterium]